MKEVNLSHIESIRQMLMEVDYHIASAIYAKDTLIKFTARSKYASGQLRRALRKWKRQNKLCFILYGEDFEENDLCTQFLLNRFPSEENDVDLGAANPYITIACVCL
jgi:hypothetical protein